MELDVSNGENFVTLSLNNNKITSNIEDVVPFESRVSTWGGEIYFPVPVDAEPETLTKTVTVGDVAFWHEGKSLAIFFGPTPMSEDNGQPVPADDVEVIGEVVDGLNILDHFEAGQDLFVKAVD